MAKMPEEINVKVNVDGKSLEDALTAISIGEQAMLLRAADLDERRQLQIQRQADIITRLCGDENGAARILELASELSDMTWQRAVLQAFFEELVKSLREVRGGAADAYHVIGIQNTLEEMADTFGIKKPLDEIAPMELHQPTAVRRFRLGKKAK